MPWLLRRVVETLEELGHVQVQDLVSHSEVTDDGEDWPSVTVSLHRREGALLHSIARNDSLVDGNKRLALSATIAFYGLNGLRLTLSNDHAYELIMAVAAGELDDVEVVAGRLQSCTAPWS